MVAAKKKINDSKARKFYLNFKEDRRNGTSNMEGILHKPVLKIWLTLAQQKYRRGKSSVRKENKVRQISLKGSSKWSKLDQVTVVKGNTRRHQHSLGGSWKIVIMLVREKQH